MKVFTGGAVRPYQLGAPTHIRSYGVMSLTDLILGFLFRMVSKKILGLRWGRRSLYSFTISIFNMSTSQADSKASFMTFEIVSVFPVFE